MVAGIFAGEAGRKLVHYAVVGTAGNLVVRGATAARPIVAPIARRMAVSGMVAGILGARKANSVAEEARLRVGDLVAEAYEQLGEEAPAPAAAAAPEHEH